MSHRGTKALKAQQEKNRIRRERRAEKKEEPSVVVAMHTSLHDGGSLVFSKREGTNWVSGKVDVVFKWGKLTLTGTMDEVDGDRISSFLRIKTEVTR